MNPFFFGASERPLFGVYTHAKSGSGPPRSVLLCYPIGSEYMRAHRAFRQLNNLLNRAGLNVLRFDYSCTGDSAGAGVDATLDSWLDDVSCAVDELKDNAMTESVTVVGLRWGAALAAVACAERTDVDHLLLWDPVISGGDYLDQHLGTPRPSGVVGVEGFPFTPALVSALESIDLFDTLSTTVHPTVTVLVAEERDDYQALRSTLEERNRGERFELVPSSGNWAQADPFGDALIPQRIIQEIVDTLSVGAAR